MKRIREVSVALKNDYGNWQIMPETYFEFILIRVSHAKIHYSSGAQRCDRLNYYSFSVKVLKYE
jgi:hypothetical protein